MIRKSKNPKKEWYSPEWREYLPSDIDKNSFNLKIQRDQIQNEINEYFELYTEYLATRQRSKAEKYKKLHEDAVKRRDKLQEKIEKFSKSKNPRCRTIQVRRKICNPKEDVSKLLNRWVIISSDGYLEGKLVKNSNHKDEFRVYDESQGITILFHKNDVRKIIANQIILKDK